MSDVIVINLCNEILTDHAEAARLGATRYDDPEIEPIAARVRLGLDRIATMSAAGVAGIKAKARLCQAIPRDDLAASLMADVMSLPA